MTNPVDSKEVALTKLELKGISRRSFIKYCTATAAFFGMNYYFGGLFAEAATIAMQKKPVIWLQGQGCTGCSCSLLSSMSPGPGEILLDSISMRFNTTLMNSAGEVSANVLKSTIEKGGYLLVIEGSVPTADPRFCVVEGKYFDDLLREAAHNADAVIAAGTCAAYGGIPKAGITGARGVSDIIDKPVVNIPGCPFNPNWLVGTLLYYLNFNELPALDSEGRPSAYFGNHFVHDTCPRVGYFEKGLFLEDWNNPGTVDWCLLKKGCKGPVTYADCNRVWFNDGVNSCIRAGSPCAGCVQPEFYEDLAPLYVSPLDSGDLQLVGLMADHRSVDIPSAALGAGIIAAPLIVNKVAELMKKKKEGEVKVGK